MAHDITKLPKWAQRHIKDLESHQFDLQSDLDQATDERDGAFAQLAEARAELAELKSQRRNNQLEQGELFSRVIRKVNPHGPVFNCRLADGVKFEGINLAAAAREIGADLNGRYSQPREDRHGATWVDFYGTYAATEQQEDAA